MYIIFHVFFSSAVKSFRISVKMLTSILIYICLLSIPLIDIKHLLMYNDISFSLYCLRQGYKSSDIYNAIQFDIPTYDS